MSREDPQLKLRLTEELKAKVTDAARANKRSVNSEIAERLDRSFFENTERNFLTMLVEQPAPQVLPKGLASRIQAKAEERGQSVQEEVMQALERAFPPPPTLDDIIGSVGSMVEGWELRLRGIDPWAPKDLESLERDYQRWKFYLDFLTAERAAGRGDTARERFRELYEELPDGTFAAREQG